MAILDTDGFSINGARRLPARQFSDEYIAPEAQDKKPEQLGLEQDLFALTVIIFRLLNNGIHPYQGVDAGNHPTNLQERINAGLYAYGCAPHASVEPAPASIHHYFENDTRYLFDDAFQATTARPTAEEWRSHLHGLITNKVLAKCAINPKEHAHFTRGCGLCAQDRRMAGARAAASRAASTAATPIETSNRISNPPPTAKYRRAALIKLARQCAGLAWPGFTALALVTIAIGVLVFHRPPVRVAPVAVEPSPVWNFQITNAALASSIQHGEPQGITRKFEGPGTHTVLFFNYQNAIPLFDLITITVSQGSAAFEPCGSIVLIYSQGLQTCEWVNYWSGDQKVAISLNHRIVRELSFSVNQPFPPVRLAPSAQLPHDLLPPIPQQNIQGIQ
jgi:hypothetical protein